MLGRRRGAHSDSEDRRQPQTELRLFGVAVVLRCVSGAENAGWVDGESLLLDSDCERCVKNLTKRSCSIEPASRADL
jgi:hypothetical protein